MKTIPVTLCLLFLYSITLSAQMLTQRVLDKNEVIQGTSFKKGTIIFQDENNYLHKAILAEDQALADMVLGNVFPHIFPKGSTVIFKRPVNIFGKPETNPFIPEKIIVSKKMKIHDVPIAATTEVIVYGGSLTLDESTTYHTGVTIVLIEDATIRGKRLKKGDLIKIESKEKIQVSTNSSEWVEL